MGGAGIPSLIPVFTHQGWMGWGLARGGELAGGVARGGELAGGLLARGGGADIPSLIPVSQHQGWMGGGLAGGAGGADIPSLIPVFTHQGLIWGGGGEGSCVELISILELLSVRPSFVKLTQLAQLNKISHTWQYMELVIV